MSKRVRLAVAVCAFLAITQSAVAQGGAKVANEFTSIGKVPASGQVLLVTFTDRPSQATVETRLAGLGAVSESVPEIGIWALAPRRAATARAQVLTRSQVAWAEWSMLRRTDDLTDVRPVPPPALPLITAAEPTDPYYVGVGQDQQWSLHQGNWTLGLSGYDRPTIAILDSGVDGSHEEWSAPGLLVFPRSTVRHIDRADDISDKGHGTHVAGIAAAPANGIGVVGVAPASASPALPGVSKVMPVQISDVQGVSTDATMVAGIRWAVNHGARVINISSGGPGASNAFQDTVDWAFKRGALITASVGNEGLPDPLNPQAVNPVNFPAGYDHVIGVGALCDGVAAPPDCPAPFGRAEFSNHNYTVDVLAPGVNILSTVPLAIQERRVAPGYAYKDGTSMAAPYVAGVVALIYASHPGITPYQVTRILQATSSNAQLGKPRSSTWGWGAVNPLLAAQAQAPVDDLSEINDDVKWLLRRDTLRLTRTPISLTARMDYNDDQFDDYAVWLRKGERVKVTIISQHAKIGLTVYRPGTSSTVLGVRTARQLAAKRLGQIRRPTPGTRAVVVRAKETGRHFIALDALAHGDDYTLVMQRL